MEELKGKISIIVPVHKVEGYLRKCIRSILDQTYRDLEIILIDDGSPDNCGRICDAFAREDERIKVIHRENGGLCAARNTGLEAATGDYIGFVDSDDHIDPDMYEYLLENLIEYDADISCCRFYRENLKGEITIDNDNDIHIYDSEEAVRELLNLSTIKAVFWNKLFKKELFDGVHFPEGVKFEGTLMMHKMFLKADKIIHLPEAKYYYLMQPNSIIHTKSIRNQCDYVRAQITRYGELIERFPDLKETMMRKIIKELSILTMTAFVNPEDIDNNMADIRNFGSFARDNKTYIDSLDGIGRTAHIDLQYIMEPTSPNLERSKLTHRLFDKKSRSTVDNLKKSRNRIKGGQKAPKMQVSMSDLTQEDKERLSKLHKIEIELMDEMVRICDKHGLVYFLYGGTLLGAVRHKGFIPWDDDVDIIMPRKDYDRFAELCKSELNEKYFYQSYETSGVLPFLFAKLRKNNTVVEEEKFREIDLHKGIYIDILPLDYFPEIYGYRRRVFLANFNVIHAACQMGRIRTKHRINRIRYEYYKKLPKERLMKIRDDLVRNAARGKETSLVCSFGSHYRPMYRRIFPAEWFVDDGTKMEFEGKMYKVPAGWKEYLEHLYGESYMELPPMYQRVNHFNFYEVDFGEEE